MNSAKIWTDLEKKGVKPFECEVITNISKNGNTGVTHRVKYCGTDPEREKEIKGFENEILNYNNLQK